MKKINWGVIGAGGIARTRTIPGILLAENAELVGIMDPNPAMRESMGQSLGVPAYATTEELLADPKVEAVYIASPVFAHLEQVEQAAAAGKHILIEKPAGRNTNEIRTMLECCEAAGVKIGVGFMMRFHSYHQKIKELIAAGTLGQVVSARVQQIFYYPDLPNCWRQQKELSGGGALMDVGIHNIDLIEYITGSRTKQVTGFTDTRTFSYDVDDASNLLLRLENGAVAYIDGAFNMHAPQGGNLLEIYGTKGTILIQGSVGQAEAGTVKSMILDTEGKRQTLTFDEPNGNMYQKEIEAFSKAVIENEPAPVPLTDGLWVQQVAEAAYQAEAEGRVITL